MSLMQISEKHISTVLTFANRNGMTFFDDNNAEFSANVIEDLTKLGKIIVAANMESIQNNYHDTEDNTEFFVNAFRFKFTKEYSPIQIVKACEFVDYQCCEANNWTPRYNFACRIVAWIKSAAIKQIPGYSESVWGID